MVFKKVWEEKFEKICYMLCFSFIKCKGLLRKLQVSYNRRNTLTTLSEKSLRFILDEVFYMEKTIQYNYIEICFIIILFIRVVGYMIYPYHNSYVRNATLNHNFLVYSYVRMKLNSLYKQHKS